MSAESKLRESECTIITSSGQYFRWQGRITDSLQIWVLIYPLLENFVEPSPCQHQLWLAFYFRTIKIIQTQIFPPSYPKVNISPPWVYSLDERVLSMQTPLRLEAPLQQPQPQPQARKHHALAEGSWECFAAVTVVRIQRPETRDLPSGNGSSRRGSTSSP